MSKHRRLRATLGALVVGSSLALAAPAAPASDLPGSATFTVQGSVEQLALTHAAPGATIALERPAGGATLATGTVDVQGSLLFRDLAPGDGYVAVQDDGGTLTQSPPITVLDPDWVPPQSSYDSQVLADGFGYLATRDGTLLSVTVHLPGPASAGPYPTVVEYSGYDPSNPYAPQPSTLIAQTLGYATVGVNMRGTGCSGGSFMYFEELQSLDGYDVIETVAAQPWVAHDAVGMVGVSYPGISQLFVARTQPPHLAAIAPLSVIADTYRSTLYPGGIFNDGFALDWAKDRVDNGKPYGQGWERRVVDAGGPNGAQCAENQLLRLQNPDLVQIIADNPFYETERGDPLSPVTFTDRFDVPVFMAGAWQDEQTGGHFPSMWDGFDPSIDTHLTATNGTHVESLLSQLNRWYEFLEFYVARRVPHLPDVFRLLAPAIIESQTGVAGVPIEADRFTGYSSYEEALAAYQAEPPVRIVFENGGDPAKPGAPIATFERSFSQWPPAETAPATWWFQPDQRLSESPPTVPDGDGKATTTYGYDPSAKPRTNYSGSTGSIWKALPAWHWEPLPLGKALAFDSDPLASEIVMAGSGSIDLWLRSTATDTDLEVTLTELRPDGRERYVQSGWLRASHRALDLDESTELRPWHTHLAADAAALPPGELVPVRVELFPFAHVFRPGSRLRITVEAPGGNRPFWTLDALPADGTVVNEIGHSIGYASRAVLPVIPGVDAPDVLPACPSLRGQPCRTLHENATPVGVIATSGSGDTADAADATREAHGAVSATEAVQVTWAAPAGTRPGATIAGFTVTESPGGATVEVAADATAAVFDSLAYGAHWFTVEARYSEGGTSGRSTPSNTVTLVDPAATTTTTTTTTAPATTTTTTAPESTTTTEPAGTTTDPTTTTTVSDSTTTTSSPSASAAATTTTTRGYSTTTTRFVSRSGSLPFTGGGAGLAATGAAAVLAGSALLALRRRPPRVSRRT